MVPTQPAPAAYPSPFLPTDEETIAQLAGRRRIWSPYHGFGTLTGQSGTPPEFAHVAEYPRPAFGTPVRLQHSSAFFVLN